MKFTIDQIVSATGAQYIPGSTNYKAISQIVIDSRLVIAPNETLFVSLVGNRHNGHDFICPLYAQGVRHFLVTQKLDSNEFPEANFYCCKDAIESLQGLGIYHRNQFDFNVIGITGSNGKTTIKEWLFQLLNPEYHIVKSPKSYNSQIGVALSVLNIKASHNLGIFEGGISKVSEMSKIAPIIDCNLGIFTNIGSAHDEGFVSQKEKIIEKSFLFTGSDKIICSRDQKEVYQQLKEFFPTKLFTWSLEDRQAEITGEINGSELNLRFAGESGRIEIPFSDQASIENLMHCIATMLYYGYDFKTINARIGWLQHLALRLELVTGSHGCLIINDCYNADIESLSVAIDFMNQQASGKKKTLILSDMHQTDQSSDELYQNIAQIIAQNGISKIIAIGNDVAVLNNFVGSETEFSGFTSTEEALNASNGWAFDNEIVLIKGARKYELERLSYLLQSKSHAAHLEIDIDALLENLSLYQSLIPDGTKTMVMVKASAYGGGGTEISALLQYHNIDYVGVAYADEGIELRDQGIHIPILVLNPDWQHLDLLHKYNLEPEVYSIEGLRAVLKYQKDTGHQLPLHFKVDTGMHRLGFDPGDLSTIKTLVQEIPIRVQSIFSHLSAGDDPQQDNFTRSQLTVFDEFYAAICEFLDYKPMRHILNSTGILRHSGYSYEMVRLGKGIYGIDLPEEYIGNFSRVHTLKANISQIKHIPKGASIGYNAKQKTDSARILATVNIGYADGVFRTAGNGVCKFLVKDQLAPTLGNICMDMFMMDITGLKDVAVGDEVEIYGKHLPIETIATQMGTVPLELLCGISSRVKRIYFRS